MDADLEEFANVRDGDRQCGKPRACKLERRTSLQLCNNTGCDKGRARLRNRGFCGNWVARKLPIWECDQESSDCIHIFLRSPGRKLDTHAEAAAPQHGAPHLLVEAGNSRHEAVRGEALD